MTKETSINGVLFQSSNEIAKLRINNPMQYRANRQFYDFFLKHNATAINHLQDEITELDSHYAALDENGKQIEGKFRDDADKEKYKKEFEELMMKPVIIRYL